MHNKFTFASGYVSSRIKSRLYASNSRPERYAGKKKLTLQEGNDNIYKLLQTDTPFMAARYGAVETSIIEWRLAQKLNFKGEFSSSRMESITNNAGFFPKDQELVAKFADLMLEKSSLADLIGVFYWNMEEYIVKHFAPQANLVRARGLEPWYVDEPWTRGLAGKKVLVVHPFESTINSQYEKRELIFPDKDILPAFELKTLKAVQTIAGEKDERFENWFEALDYMHDEAMKKDFDVAIIGCGAYGFPLAAKLKESGKQAIHMGGATQYLFGIKSKRADEGNAVIRGLYTDAWVRASSEETPKNANKVEGGCYW